MDQSDHDAVLSVLRGDWLTQGPVARAFEQALAAYCGVKFAVSVSSGTAALHIAALAAGLAPGSRLWTSPNSFVASANCGLYCGAEIDFVDIDPNTGNMCMQKLSEKLAIAKKIGKTPDVIIPVHFAGEPVNLDALAEIKSKYGIRIIEDAAHALGASYRDIKIGSCRVADLSVLSFHPVKSITAGEGGMVLTNDQNLYQKLLLFSQQGITHDHHKFENNITEPWYYEQLELGYNYRLSDIHAALGLNQLKRLDNFIAQRHVLAKRYDKAFSDLPIKTLVRQHNAQSALHLYVIRILSQNTNLTRLQVYQKLLDQGIKCQIHYIPIHLQPIYRRLGFKKGDFINAENLYQEVLSLPLYPNLSSGEQNTVISAVVSAFSKS